MLIAWSVVLFITVILILYLIKDKSKPVLPQPAKKVQKTIFERKKATYQILNQQKLNVISKYPKILTVNLISLSDRLHQIIAFLDANSSKFRFVYFIDRPQLADYRKLLWEHGVKEQEVIGVEEQSSVSHCIRQIKPFRHIQANEKVARDLSSRLNIKVWFVGPQTKFNQNVEPLRLEQP